MLSFIRSRHFQVAQWTETKTPCPQGSPCRGWYRIYEYRLEDDAWEEPVRYAGESLALVLLNIGAYREMDLDEGALKRMDECLARFEKLGFDLILRICYDTEGKGMVREPSLFSQVKKHVMQLAPILLSHAEHVFVYQGLLVGNWGEMHGSKFLLPEKVKELTETFLEATKGRIPLAVRKPAQARMAYAEGAERSHVGFFNDGMLGSKTHLGTFALPSTGRGAWQEPWSPEEELKFMKPFLAEVPYGGEVVAGQAELSAEQTVEVLRSLQVSYLNAIHDESVLSAWKETPYQDGTLWEYVSAHLGYRLLAKRVSVSLQKGLKVSLEVQNGGFGALYEDVGVEISLGRKGQERTVLGMPEGSLKGLQSGECRTLFGSFAFDPKDYGSANGTLSLYARLLRKRDGQCFYFSQASEDGSLLLGNLR